MLQQMPAPAQETAPTLIVLPAPTSTPLIVLPTATLIPTLIPVTPTETTNPDLGQGIQVGLYVQVTGTEGSGLRLHADAGTSSTSVTLAAESEVFQVKDGPRQSDGITWWYLVAPYNPDRKGWAAGSYLVVIQNP